jgi:acylaminoacyl-peptidase
MIHGGPFACYPQDFFSKILSLHLLSKRAVLLVNYRGSIGFGGEFLEELLGGIGSKDVQDVGKRFFYGRRVDQEGGNEQQN